MAETCKTCGGELITMGNNYRYCAFCGNAYGTEKDAGPQRLEKNEIENLDIGASVFNKNINSVLEIRWTDGQYLHSGSGLIISRDGYAITNTHVVTAENGSPCKTVEVSVGGDTYAAKVLAIGDTRHGLGSGIDLAIIKLDNYSSGRPVTLADFAKVNIGERVFVIGNSLGYGTCITSGIVSDKRREVNGKMLLMTDCAINGGNSGGPMFNAKGDVIAVIVSGITGAEGMNFAIPVDDVIAFINGCSQKININI